jgi:hypothetical protein
VNAWGWLSGWPGASSPPACDPLHLHPRLETLAMRLTALLVRVLVHLGLLPQTEELYQYLET